MKTLSIMFSLLLIGCGFQIGPAYPKKDAKEFLNSKSYPAPFIQDVLERKNLTHEKVLELRKLDSHDVHFLVGSNPNISHSEIDLFIGLKNDYARSGTALNTKLSKIQITKLFNDPSHTVYCKLAQNESINSSTLINLHKTRNPGLVYFAMNPSCPEEIKTEIRNSNDDLAKKWLDITQKSQN